MASATRGKGAILLVEDDAAVRHTFERLLRLAGYDVVAVPDASAALLAMADAPAAVLVDLRVTTLNGLDMVRQIRASETEGHRTPIAFITGDYFLGDAVELRLQELHTGLYFKPLFLNDLLQIVDKLLTSALGGIAAAPKPN